jgi:RNA polymerase sigma-70 factor (ECF subfamily)
MSHAELVRLCSDGASSAAWQEFVSRYQAILESSAAGVARRWGSSSREELDDLMQEIYLKLCANRAELLQEFRDERPEALFGYLRVIGVNTAHDYFRSRAAAKRGGLVTEQMAEWHEAKAVRETGATERRLMLLEIDRIMCKHTETENGPRDRAVFRLYYRHGMTAKAIAELPGIGLSLKGVEGVVYRLTSSIRKEMK